VPEIWVPMMMLTEAARPAVYFPMLQVSSLKVLRTVLGRAGLMMLAGPAASITAGFAASRLLSGVVYQASSGDPLVLLSAAVAVTTTALGATWLPARRALRIDPVRAQRED
jgi:ABC-type antimicrobial peptide transport system permease subunit